MLQDPMAFLARKQAHWLGIGKFRLHVVGSTILLHKWWLGFGPQWGHVASNCLRQNHDSDNSLPP